MPARALIAATLPGSVNFRALDTRFFRTCSSRCGSVSTALGTFGRDLDWKANFFSPGDRREQPMQIVPDASSPTGLGRDFHVAGLDLRQVEDVVDQVQQIIARRPNRLGVLDLFVRQIVVGLSASSLARISDELSGVRSSCDMLARKSDLYRLACSSSRALR